MLNSPASILNTRRSKVAPGLVAWIDNDAKDSTPVESLAHGTRVVVMVKAGGATWMVRDEGGLAHLVEAANLARWEFEIDPGRWLDEADPELLGCFAEMHERIMRERTNAPIEAPRATTLKHLKTFLMRHGPAKE